MRRHKKSPEPEVGVAAEDTEEKKKKTTTASSRLRVPSVLFIETVSVLSGGLGSNNPRNTFICVFTGTSHTFTATYKNKKKSQEGAARQVIFRAAERPGGSTGCALNVFHTPLLWRAPTQLKCPLSSRRGARGELISQRTSGNHRINKASY